MENKEFWTRERCFIKELLNHSNAPNVSLAVARVAPGVTTQLHALAGVNETYIVRKGKGIVEVDGSKIPVSTNDTVFIGKDIPQRISNVGSEDLEFYCLCMPRFQQNCYINLE